MNEETDAHAQLLGHPFNLGFALTLGAYVFDYRCEPEPLFQRIAEAERLEREQSVPFMKMVMVPQVEGLARLRTGHVAESIYSLRQGLENWNNSGGHSRVPYLKAVLAEALARRGDVDAALIMIEEVLEQIERPGWQERSHLAEVLRLKGWMLMRKGRHEEAQRSLQASIEWGRRQQAKSWELRTATTLAELYIADRQFGAAREVLAPVYNWFTEGFATHDVKAARRVLESLR